MGKPRWLRMQSVNRVFALTLTDETTPFEAARLINVSRLLYKTETSLNITREIKTWRKI
jgi:hypothetical protein